MGPEAAAEIGRISAALVAVLAEAKTMADAGQFGPDFAELVRHARELGELLTEALVHNAEAVGEYARGVAASLTAAIENLEEMLRDPGPMH
jgi:hypothetical protein